MVVRSLASSPLGASMNAVVQVDYSNGSQVFGKQMPFGVPVTFDHEGLTVGRYTLYNVVCMSRTHDGLCVLRLDSRYKPLPSRAPEKSDLLFAHDVFCGIGGFSSALNELGMTVVAAVDWNKLAVDAFKLNHQCSVIHADIGIPDTLYQLHELQLAMQCQPMLLGVFPCQPLSQQGSQLREMDSRSQPFLDLLDACFLLNSSGLCLECVPGALSDPFTQHALEVCARLCGFPFPSECCICKACGPAVGLLCWFLWTLALFPSLICLVLPKPLLFVTCFLMRIGQFGILRRNNS